MVIVTSLIIVCIRIRICFLCHHRMHAYSKITTFLPYNTWSLIIAYTITAIIYLYMLIMDDNLLHIISFLSVFFDIFFFFPHYCLFCFSVLKWKVNEYSYWPTSDQLTKLIDWFWRFILNFSFHFFQLFYIIN